MENILPRGNNNNEMDEINDEDIKEFDSIYNPSRPSHMPKETDGEEVQDEEVNIPKENNLGTSPFSGNPIVSPNKRPDEAKEGGKEENDILDYKPSTDIDTEDDGSNEQKPMGKRASNVEELLFNISQTSDYHIIDLPSRGLLYKEGSDLKTEQLLVRAMRAGEEEILTSPQMFKDGKAIELIFKRCIMFNDKKSLETPLELLSIDRMYLLIWIRASSYSTLYECSLNCSSCRRQFDAHIDLDDDLSCTFLDEPSFKEPILDVFPRCGYEFEYRLSRGYDELELVKMQRMREKEFSKATDQTLFNRACLLVESIGGIKDKKDIKKCLKNMSLEDLSYLRHKFNNPPFGVDTNISLDCPYCGSENETILPMGTDFFFPRLTKKKIEY